MHARIWSLVAMLSIAGCGGGGGSNGGGSPPTGLSYPSPQVFVVSQAIAAVNPTVTGSVTSYSISPALPSGLTINATTGVISGTPTTPTAPASYTVTAANAAGSTTGGLSVTVNDTAPSISYDSASYSFTTGAQITAITPLSTGGGVTGWSINRPLPAGLTFNTISGSISGVPTASSAASTYVVTAQNPGGSDTFELTITVGAVLLDLGHSREIVAVHREGNRVLSVDFGGHWALWDAANEDLIVQGDVVCSEGAKCGNSVSLAGSIVAARTATDLRLHDATDGHALATVPTSATWWKLASDGSYVAAGSPTEITAWNNTGMLLFSRTGNYASGIAFAAPAELRIAGGAAGANTLEKIAVSNAATTTTQFQGNFFSWFVDGNRFLTNVAETVRVYGLDGMQQDIQTLPVFDALVGQGDYFWIERRSPRQLAIFSVGNSTPAATFALPASAKTVASADTIGIIEASGAAMSIVDLSPATPVKTDYTQPLVDQSAYGTGTGGEWFMGNDAGVLIATTAVPVARYFGFGAAWSIAATAERIAVATAAGKVLYFDADSKQLEGSMDFASSKVRLSNDGSVLAAMATDSYAQYQTDRTLRIYLLPSETLIRDEPYDLGTTPWAVDFSLSTSGDVFGRILSTGTVGTYDRQVYAAASGVQPLQWSDTVTPTPGTQPPPIHLSPNGLKVAASNDGQSINTGTNIFDNYVLVSAVTGMAVGWIDNNRLIVNRYVMPSFTQYQDSVIVNAAGQQLLVLPLGNLTRFQTVATDRIYSPEFNTILSLTDGQTLWESANPVHALPKLRQGGVTATDVIFASGASVRAEPY